MTKFQDRMESAILWILLSGVGIAILGLIWSFFYPSEAQQFIRYLENLL